MKRTAALLITALLVLSLAACGTTPPASSAAPPASTAPASSTSGESASSEPAPAETASGGGQVTAWLGDWWANEVPRLETDFVAQNPEYMLKIELMPVNNYVENATTAILGAIPPTRSPLTHS